MTPSEENQFITEYMTVMGVSEQDQNSLTVVNFGYDGPLPFLSIALSPNTPLSLNLQTSGIQSQSKRSIAVVGEKFLNRFEEIMSDIDKIRKDTQALPFAIFLQSKNEINLMNLSSHPMRESPSLVGIVLSIIVKRSLSYTEAVEN